MKKNGRTTGDGIKRRKKITRTRSHTRSFTHTQNLSGTTSSRQHIVSPQEKNIRKRKRSDAISMKKKKVSRAPRTVPVPQEILTTSDYSEFNDVTFNKNKFYTPPKRISARFSWWSYFSSLVKKYPKVVGFVVRVGVVGILLVMFLNRSYSATVSLQPHREYQAIDGSMTLHKNPQENQLGFDIFALTDEQSLSITAQDTKIVKKKANGNITIFNDYSTESQRLLPETRFRSASGKIFKLGSEEVVVPGKKGAIPGQITVRVWADEPGELYNIDITDFTIPGYQELGLTQKYNGMYAVSEKAFTGGFIGSEPVVTDMQQAQARQQLQEKLHQRLLLALQKEKTELVVLIKDSINVLYKEPEIVFDESGLNAVVTQRGTIFALVTSKKDLHNYVTENIIDQEDQEVTVSVEKIKDLSLANISDTATSIAYETIDRITIKYSGEALAVFTPDLNVIKSDLVGVSKDRLISYFDQQVSVDRAWVTVRPFWKKNLPSRAERIEVKNSELD